MAAAFPRAEWRGVTGDAAGFRVDESGGEAAGGARESRVVLTEGVYGAGRRWGCHTDDATPAAPRARRPWRTCTLVGRGLAEVRAGAAEDPMQVACPKCSTPIPLDDTSKDESGRVRARCPKCSTFVLVKVNRPALRVAAEIPSHSNLPAVRDEDITSLGSASGAFAPIDPDPTEAVEAPSGLAPWAFVIDTLDSAKVDEARRRFRTLPRFRRQPQRVDELGGQLPWWVRGVTPREAKFLLEQLVDLGGEGRAQPESVVLDDKGRPVPRPEPGEADVLEDHDEVAFDGESLASDPAVWAGQTMRPDALGEIDVPPPALRSGEIPRPTGAPHHGILAAALPLGRDPARADFIVVTADSLLPAKHVLGLVRGFRLVPATSLDGAGQRVHLVDEALRAAERDLSDAAKRLGADAVVGVRVDQGPVPAGEAGLDWLVVMIGTAIQRA